MTHMDKLWLQRRTLAHRMARRHGHSIGVFSKRVQCGSYPNFYIASCATCWNCKLKIELREKNSTVYVYKDLPTRLACGMEAAKRAEVGA